MVDATVTCDMIHATIGDGQLIGEYWKENGHANAHTYNDLVDTVFAQGEVAFPFSQDVELSIKLSMLASSLGSWRKSKCQDVFSYDGASQSVKTIS